MFPRRFQVLLLPALALGLDVVPDSLVIPFSPFSSREVDTVRLVNRGNAGIRVDSIHVRFLDGGDNGWVDDFSACRDCVASDFNAYVYRGWVYETQPFVSLRWVKDSLYLLQDKQGRAFTLDAPGASSAAFPVNYFVNCPFCGRLPTYPTTNAYRFTFHVSDGSRAGLAMRYTRSSGLSPGLAHPAQGAPQPGRHDAAGRRARPGPEPAFRLFIR